MSEYPEPQLFYVYDMGFRWGVPDLTWPLSSSKPADSPNFYGPCEVPGCFVCKGKIKERRVEL